MDEILVCQLWFFLNNSAYNNSETQVMRGNRKDIAQSHFVFPVPIALTMFRILVFTITNKVDAIYDHVASSTSDRFFLKSRMYTSQLSGGEIL